MKFRARFFRPGTSQVEEVIVEGQTAHAVRSDLERDGNAVLLVDAIKESGLVELLQRGRRQTATAAEWALLCRELRTLVKAGMTVVEAMETLSAKVARDHGPPSVSTLLLNKLRSGISLSTAIEQCGGAPSVLVAAVRAGERTSNLIEALDDFLRFDALVAHLRKKIVSAAIYPALVTTLGLSIILFLMLVVMPKFANVYSNLRNAPEGNAALTIAVSRFVGANRSIVIAILIAVIVGVVVWVRSGTAANNMKALIRSVPWAYARMKDFQLAMMYQALALLLKGGYPMTLAMEIAAKAALAPELTAGLNQALKKIERGGGVSKAFSEQGLCDDVGRRLMAAAERNGDFYRVVEVVAALHSERFELFVERLTRVVEPVLLLIVALGVGSVVLMMYAPVFDLATQLQ